MPFCEHQIVTSTPHSSWRYSTDPSDEIVSTSSKAGWLALSIAARISGIWLAHPVEVSLWTTVTALTACPGSAASLSWTWPAWTPWRQSPGTTSTSRPSFLAICDHKVAKWPASKASTRSPGDSVLTSAASQAPVPDEG